MDEEKKQKAKSHLVLLTVTIIGGLIVLSLISMWMSSN
jgi:flagellar basal body-associated protein FliL